MPKASAALSIEPKPTHVTSTKVEGVLGEYLQVAAKLSQLEARKKELQADLVKLHEKYGKKFETDEFASAEIESRNVSIKREHLFELGVKASVIQKAMAMGTTDYTYARVSRKTGDAAE